MPAREEQRHERQHRSKAEKGEKKERRERKQKAQQEWKKEDAGHERLRHEYKAIRRAKSMEEQLPHEHRAREILKGAGFKLDEDEAVEVSQDLKRLKDFAYEGVPEQKRPRDGI